ncbi:MAG: aldehyde ferredoxin oxidoreductase [Caldilineaceae bacterium]|nr:aldehyde ferredoxin oxidoreductase [Caldilineaceae bacterium]
MRKFLQINLTDRSVVPEEKSGEQLVKVGRYLIAKTLLEMGAAAIDPNSPENPLIFSAGPMAGTSYSNANRTSVGCKSPLTGGIKEANGGGTFSYALGQLEISGFTLHGAADEWVVIHLTKDGAISFDDATPYLGKGNYEAAALLHERYGKKVSLALCGPVGEYGGLIAGIAFSDSDRRPSRLAARGGVGAVMGNKRVKAIVADLDKMPALYDRKAVLQDVRTYARMLQDDPVVTNFYNAVGTMGMADYMNHVGGLPVRNFSAGQLVDADEGVFKMGGDFIGPRNTERGGEQTHACMPGCVIQCSNIYVDAEGKEVTSPVEYETLGLLGSNCGITEPDYLAALNHIANDLGVDTIETGAMLAVLMEAGLADFGDVDFMIAALKEIRAGSQKGRIWAQGTARAGAYYGLARVPVIKRQAISAYDPRVAEVTGITMMASAQGADHTAGNAPRYPSHDKELDELVDVSLDAQIGSAAADSVGLCIFGRTVTGANVDFITQSFNDATGANLEPSFFEELGRETLRLEAEFNRLAGFTAADDELPAFFYDEPIPPTDHVARFHGEDVHNIYAKI